jgi:hypothetical protein
MKAIRSEMAENLSVAPIRIAAISRRKNSRKSLTSCFSTSSEVGTVETVERIGTTDDIAQHQRARLWSTGS